MLPPPSSGAPLDADSYPDPEWLDSASGLATRHGPDGVAIVAVLDLNGVLTWRPARSVGETDRPLTEMELAARVARRGPAAG